MGNSHEFDDAIAFLSKDFYCLTVDLPGHGKTRIVGDRDKLGTACAKGDRYTMENTAIALIHLLDELNISQCFLVGYSMGGRLSLYLTLNFPHRFSKVVLESASPGLATISEREERIKRDEQIARKLERSIDSKDFALYLSNWYEQTIFSSIKKHPHFDKLIKSRLQNNPIELVKSLRYMGTGQQPSLWEKLKDSTVPLLLLVGEYDEKFVEINRKMSEICQICQLEVISKVGHNIHFENTSAFVASISQFFLDAPPLRMHSETQ
jgi:2-succinyl-6-hydroxy-2,4-cyclohexadiene-1-carboxylate synthase